MNIEDYATNTRDNLVSFIIENNIDVKKLFGRNKEISLREWMLRLSYPFLSKEKKETPIVKALVEAFRVASHQRLDIWVTRTGYAYPLEIDLAKAELAVCPKTGLLLAKNRMKFLAKKDLGVFL